MRKRRVRGGCSRAESGAFLPNPEVKRSVQLIRGSLDGTKLEGCRQSEYIASDTVFMLVSDAFIPGLE